LPFELCHLNFEMLSDVSNGKRQKAKFKCSKEDSMFVYGLSLATPGTMSTNATAGTENMTFTTKPGTARNVALQAMYACGRGAGLTAISGIMHRIVSFVTASTAGTAITPTPRDPGAQAAKQTAASAQTVGVTRTNHICFGHGAAGPGGWVAPNVDSMPVQPASNIGSIDAVNVGSIASLAFEWSAETVE
jgi:hypothetical protein